MGILEFSVELVKGIFKSIKVLYVTKPFWKFVIYIICIPINISLMIIAGLMLMFKNRKLFDWLCGITNKRTRA